MRASNGEAALRCQGAEKNFRFSELSVIMAESREPKRVLAAERRPQENGETEGRSTF